MKGGDAKITGGYNLPAKFVIHTVSPIWKDGGQNERSLLALCYRRSLQCAVDNGLKSIAFPAISCGVYGFPIAKACDIAMREVGEFLDKDNVITAAYFSCFSNGVENELRRAKREWENLL